MQSKGKINELVSCDGPTLVPDAEPPEPEPKQRVPIKSPSCQELSATSLSSFSGAASVDLDELLHSLPQDRNDSACFKIRITPGQKIKKSSDLKQVRELGEGAIARVFRAYVQDGDRYYVYAIKKFSVQNVRHTSSVICFLSETRHPRN